MEGLSHSVNIGLRFLQQNYATIYLPSRTVTLKMGGAKIDLVSRTHASENKSMKKALHLARTVG